MRRLMLAKRRALLPLDVESLSFRIQQSFMASVEFSMAKTLALYAPIHHEVDTVLVQRQALFLGKRVVFPTVEGVALAFRQINAEADLVAGAFGIRSPGTASPAVPVDEIDIFIIPGVAFDLAGRRIGYGKGYYDRALHPLERCGRLVGFCYDFQLVDAIVGEPHDVTMDVIVSETRTVRP
jgi:5-formyltetrahydrofolate cyclo-ligase